MIESDLKELIDKVNELVRREMFFEFQILSCSDDQLEIIGSTDLSYYYTLKIIFKKLNFISCRNSWIIDTSLGALEFISGHEFICLNKQYNILNGNVLIKILEEDGIFQWVACESLQMELGVVKF